MSPKTNNHLTVLSAFRPTRSWVSCSCSSPSASSRSPPWSTSRRRRDTTRYTHSDTFRSLRIRSLLKHSITGGPNLQDKEDGRNPDFTWTFVESFWWGLMTITTVGYDLNPRTYLGKLIGGFTAISGIFILTLPIPIVVNSFASYYKVRSQVHLVIQF